MNSKRNSERYAIKWTSASSIRRGWQDLPRWLRGLCVLLIFNVIANLLLYTLTNDVTTIHYTGAFCFLKASKDSWAPMEEALRYISTSLSFGDKTLYAALFFEEHLKFQYSPTSLLLLEPLRWILPGRFNYEGILNIVSWLLVIALAILVARIFTLSVRLSVRSDTNVQSMEKTLIVCCAILATFTFYPLLRGFVLGQIQTWIDFLFAAMVLAWIGKRKDIAGVCAGVCYTIKPQLALLTVWAIVRKEKQFGIASVLTFAVFGVLSLLMYGVENHIDYLRVLSFLAQHGESYFPNQSFNGLLNRLLFNGSNLIWEKGSFPPYNAYVFIGTVITSLFLIGLALSGKKRESQSAGTIDLLIAALSFTMASPIAWEHHYGILIPMFAIALPVTLMVPHGRRSGISLLATAYILSSNLLPFLNLAPPEHSSTSCSLTSTVAHC